MSVASATTIKIGHSFQKFASHSAGATFSQMSAPVLVAATRTWHCHPLSIAAAAGARYSSTSSSSNAFSPSFSSSNTPFLFLNGGSSIGYNRSSSWNFMQRRTQAIYAAFYQRLKRIVSRWYARRILELAAASAATQRMITHLEEGVAVERPKDWNNWQRREWADELLESLGTSKISRLWSALSRLASLSLLAAPLAVLGPLSMTSETTKDWSWSYLLWAIEQAGPTYLKLTQWATTRPDLFSPEFCEYFAKLRDDTRGHSWKETIRILEEDFASIHDKGSSNNNNKINIHDLFEFDKTDPIGSGCIAQVYKGRLKEAAGKYPAGTEIAIKVQHPNIWNKVCVDFYIMGKVARFLENLPGLNLRYLSLVDSVEQFRDIMLPQLDLTVEAKHLQRFNRDFGSTETVGFPFPIHELTTTRVLTETFVHGKPILEFVKEPETIRQELAYLGLETTLSMIFKYDLLHGDLHPGNILVGRTKDGKKLKLLLLDCGLVIEMGPSQHVNLTKILGAFVRRKGRLAAQLMVDTSRSCQANELDVELFVNGIDRICIEDKSQNFVENVGDYIADICFLACKHKVKLEASFINAALAVEIMEGIASALYPKIVVARVAMPMIVKAEAMHSLPKLSSLW